MLTYTCTVHVHITTTKYRNAHMHTLAFSQTNRVSDLEKNLAGSVVRTRTHLQGHYDQDRVHLQSYYRTETLTSP